MPRQARDLSLLALQLQSEGATTSRVLAARLGLSQSTLSRLITELGSRVERLGAGRNIRYALRRDVRQLGGRWPIYRVSELGKPKIRGTLHSLHRGFRFVPQSTAPEWMGREYQDGLSSGLPFFLQDIRPQGYLGHAIARRVS